MLEPEVHYARTDDGLRIAYQDFGGGGPPVVFVPGIISNVEMFWEQERIRSALLRASAQARLIHFDKRGVGGSDRFDAAPTIGQRMGDIAAVLDACGLERAHLVALSEGALIGAHFALGHPERVQSLTLTNPAFFALATPDEVEHVSSVLEAFARLEASWGEDGAYATKWFVRSRSGDPSFERWQARLQRQSASPGDFRRQMESAGLIEFPDLGAISVPTFVIQATRDPIVRLSWARRAAEAIPGAELVEIDSADHFFFCGDSWRQFVDEQLRLAVGLPPLSVTTRRFATVLFTDLVGSTSRATVAGDAEWSTRVETHNRISRDLVAAMQGTYVKSTGDGLLAHFPSPSLAVECAQQLCTALRSVELDLRCGVHAGEIEVHQDGDVSGIAVNLAARVEQAAGDGEVFVSQTVRDLLLGTSHQLESRGSRKLKGIADTWELFEVVG